MLQVVGCTYACCFWLICLHVHWSTFLADSLCQGRWIWGFPDRPVSSSKGRSSYSHAAGNSTLCRAAENYWLVLQAIFWRWQSTDIRNDSFTNSIRWLTSSEWIKSSVMFGKFFMTFINFSRLFGNLHTVVNFKWINKVFGNVRKSFCDLQQL